MDTERELFILGQQMPSKCEPVLDVLRHIAGKNQDSVMWAVVGGYMYGIICGKRLERQRRKKVRA